jgi:hypothetical protein
VNNDLVCSKCGEDPYDFEPKKTVILKLTGVCHLEIEGKSPAEAIKMIGPSYQGWHITEKEAKEK